MQKNTLYSSVKQRQFTLQKSNIYLLVNISVFVTTLILCFYLLTGLVFRMQFILGLVIVVLLFYVQKCFIFAQQANPIVKQLIIDNEGYCYFALSANEKINERHKLQANSRNSVLGSWLCFEDRATIFIFKDSLSTTDFSQLRRIINQL